MSQNLHEARQSLEELKEENNIAFYFLEFFRKNPDLNCVANENLIRSFHNNGQITPESIQESVDFLGDRLARKSDERVRQDQQAQKKADQIQQQSNRAGLEEMILELLPDETKPFEQKKFKWQSIEQLELRLVELTHKRKFSQMSAAELRAYVKDARQQAPVEPFVTVTLSKKELTALSGSAMRQFLYAADGRPKKGRDAQGRTIREQVDAILRG
jgi:hypothetical protein